MRGRTTLEPITEDLATSSAHAEGWRNRKRKAGWIALSLTVAISAMAVAQLRAVKRARAAAHGNVGLSVVADKLSRPTDIEFPPGPGARAVVLGQEGEAWIVDVESGSVERWFTAAVYSNVECGLLGVAFDPQFWQNGRLYTTQCTQRDGKTYWQVMERLAPAGLSAAPVPGRLLLEVEQPWDNHKGGQLRFGNDGFLYIGLGDGGSQGDPHNRAQDLSQLFGKLLRIDPRQQSPGLPYAIPPTNPFVGVANARPEIWAYGLRNPWRFDFLPDGRLIVGDVGEQHWEEISIVAAGDNLGWSAREGRHCYKPAVGCKTEGLVDPIYEYSHEKGFSVTGGVMVWDKALPTLYGKFVFADFGVSTINAISPQGDLVQLDVRGGAPTAFARAYDNRIYVTNFVEGRLERLQASP
jgi:glucose/arabinose dehydrogenase